MFRRRVLLVALLTVAVCASGIARGKPAAPLPRYRLTILPMDRPAAINERGQVAGTRGEPGERRAFLWERGRLRALPLPEAREDGSASVEHIDAQGRVYGTVWYQPDGAISTIQGDNLVWERDQVRAGIYTPLRDPGAPRVETHEIGEEYQPDTYNTPYERIRGEKARYSHAFVWEPGKDKPRDLGTLGGKRSHASDSNAQSQVVGDAETAGGGTRAFLWQGGTMRDLVTLPGGDWSSAKGINVRGVIIGMSTVRKAGGMVRRAVMWDRAGRVVSLSGLVAGKHRPALRSADAINEQGQIVGQTADGRGYLLTPW